MLRSLKTQYTLNLDVTFLLLPSLSENNIDNITTILKTKKKIKICKD